MAKITKGQIIKMNEKMGNGFEFDIKYYLFHNEKTARKIIQMEENKCLEAKIMYRDHYEKYTQDNGISYNRQTGKKQPVLHLTLWRVDENGTATSSGLGQWINISEPQNKAMFSKLQKLTHEITDEFILEKFNNSVCTNPRIL